MSVSPLLGRGAAARRHGRARRADTASRAALAGERASAIISYMRRNPTLPVGLVDAAGARAIFLIVGRFFVEPGGRPRDLGRAAPGAVLGAPVRQRPPGPRHVRGDGRRHAADAADRPDCWLHRRRRSARCWRSSRPTTAAGSTTSFKWHRGHRPDDPGPDDPDYRRDERPSGAHRQPDGAGGRVAGLDVPDPHDPRPRC